MMKRKLFFLVLCLPMMAWAQFTQTITTTPEFCTGDGKATLSINNTVSGAVFDFRIFRLPDSTTPYRTATGIAASSSTLSYTENSLPSGNYSVTTYENRSGVIITKNASFTIGNNFVALQFTNTVATTCNLGKITANVSAGKPSTYELRKSSDNTLVIGPQPSNVFSNVAPGTYNVIVTDTCGNKKSLSATVTAEANNYSFDRSTVDNRTFNKLEDCNHFNHKISITRNGFQPPTAKFPIQIKYEVTGPGGSPVTTLNYTMNGISDNNMIVTNIPFYYNQAFTIKATLTDACGYTYTQTDNIAASTTTVSVGLPAAVCGQAFLDVYSYLTAPDYQLEFTKYPVGFKPWMYNSNFPTGYYVGTFTDRPQIKVGDFNNPVPNGSYSVKLTDACGHTATRNFSVNTDYILRNLSDEQKEGCGLNGGTHLRITANNNLQKSGDITALKIISGPTSYSSTYPVDISSQAILSDGDAYVGELPAGTYTFEANTSCGGSRQATVTFKGANYNIDRSIAYNCGSFNLTANLTSNLTNPKLYLEHYNTSKSTWEEVKEIPRPGSNISNFTGTLNNIAQTGEFRIRGYYEAYNMGATKNCTVYTETFSVAPGGLTLKNYYTVSCADNTYNLIIDANGANPLSYKIVEKDGASINIDNGTNPVFTNLMQGTYKVEIKDTCGNVRVFSTRVIANKLPKIQTSNLCDGQNGYLYVDGLSFLTVRWFKNGADTGITGNRYNFTPYHSATDTGLYEALITYEPNPNDCISNKISFNLTTANENNASAGTGGTYTLNSGDVTGPIDLFTYLKGTYDTFGEWKETTGSGLLIDNKWYANLANGGTYTFNYTVNGTCSGTDTSTVTIIFKKACYKYPATDNTITIASKHGITSLGRAGATDADNWPMTRQSAYTVLESKTKGFVVNRLNTAQIQAITDAGNTVDGMMVYDNDDDCLKIYVKDDANPSANGWHCFNTPACPQD